MQSTFDRPPDQHTPAALAQRDLPTTPPALGRPAVTRSLTLAYGASLVLAALVALASVAGLTRSAGDLYADSASVLVSRGADAANLVLVPLLLFTMWAARRGRLLGLLLWPGALFYTLYAYLPYTISASATWLLFVDVALVTLSAFTLIGLLATIDASVVRQRLAQAPAGWVGGALVAIGLLAYAGLLSNAGSTLAEVGGRGHWVADWTVGTPVLVLGGVLLWRRAPLGYVVAAGLLLVSALGGVVFAIAAAVDNLLNGPPTEPSIIVVHLAISAASGVLLAVFLGCSHARLAPEGAVS